jgi:hypothetical protein
MVAAAVVAVASVAGAAISSSASKSAANTQANAANNATKAQTALTNQAMSIQQQNNAPYIQAGDQALSQIQQVLGLTAPPKTNTPTTGGMVGGNTINGPGAALTNGSNPNAATGTTPGGFNPANIPGFTYGLNQVEESQVAQGLARGLGGNTLGNIATAGQGYAGQAYQQYLANLSGVAQMGQASAVGQANASSNLLGNLGNQIGSNTIGAGNAIAAGQVGSANAYSGAINNGVNQYYQQQTLANIFGGNNSLNPNWQSGVGVPVTDLSTPVGST